MFAQCADEGADCAGQHERLGDAGERGLRLLRQRLLEPGAEAAATVYPTSRRSS
ncbi:hypothetical protein [Streptomyces sp. NPDC048419]|uniref:hypothetical protein n=1 Tax=Streptomyces sp. NPDC048419 TaxID=3365547 RepID=UPI00371E10E3